MENIVFIWANPNPCLLLLLLLFLFLSCQLTYKKKRKVERTVLCEKFMERASRPQELISVELLEVSGDSTPSAFTADLLRSVTSCHLSPRRNCPTSMRSTRSWRLLSCPRQKRRLRPPAWSVKTWSLSCAALWWTSTSGSRGRWDLDKTSVFFIHYCPLSVWWDAVMSRQDGTDEGEDSGEETSSQVEVSYASLLQLQDHRNELVQRAPMLTVCLFCVLSAPRGPSASPPSNQKLTDRQRRFVFPVSGVFFCFHIYSCFL